MQDTCPCNCSVFTDSTIDQILLIISDGGTQRPRALNANAAALHWVCEKPPLARPSEICSSSHSEKTGFFYHCSLTWKIPWEHVHYCQILMESGRYQTKIALPSSAALSSCFMVTLDGGGGKSWCEIAELRPSQCDPCPRNGGLCNSSSAGRRWPGLAGMSVPGEGTQRGWWSPTLSHFPPAHEDCEEAALGEIVTAWRRWALNCCSGVESDPGFGIEVRDSWSSRGKRTKNKAYFKMTTERHPKRCWAV